MFYFFICMVLDKNTEAQVNDLNALLNDAVSNSAISHTTSDTDWGFNLDDMLSTPEHNLHLPVNETESSTEIEEQKSDIDIMEFQKEIESMI